MEIEGSHVVVTGGAHGIGRALCQAFAAAEARVVGVADVDAAAARAVADAVGGRASTVDVRDGAALARLVDDAEAADGPIDLFCSNAGITLDGGPEVPDADWQRIWEVNVMAHVWAARALVPRMLERGGGHLLHTASAAGLLSQIGSAPYTATKHAAVGFAEWLAITYGARGLRVSVLCPQAVRTDMTAHLEGGGVAGVDGMLEPEAVAESALRGLREDRFLILPHPEVQTYVERKAGDRDRWLRGMRRLQERHAGGGGG